MIKEKSFLVNKAIFFANKVFGVEGHIFIFLKIIYMFSKYLHGANEMGNVGILFISIHIFYKEFLLLELGT